MSRIITREMRRQLERDNAKQPLRLTPIPRELWPVEVDPTRVEAYRSRDYLAQVFNEGEGVLRISANRTTPGDDGRWNDGLSWDELMEIKRQLGMGDKYAIEVYPRDKDIINVANMRHLWVFDKPLAVGWFK